MNSYVDSAYRFVCEQYFKNCKNCSLIYIMLRVFIMLCKTVTMQFTVQNFNSILPVTLSQLTHAYLDSINVSILLLDRFHLPQTIIKIMAVLYSNSLVDLCSETK